MHKLNSINFTLSDGEKKQKKIVIDEKKGKPQWYILLPIMIETAKEIGYCNREKDDISG